MTGPGVEARRLEWLASVWRRSIAVRPWPLSPKTRSVRLLNPRKHNWQLAPADRETTASPRRRGAWLSVIARTAQQALVPIDSSSRAIVSAGDTALLRTREGAARWPNRRRLRFHERDHPAADHGVIALDGLRSRDELDPRDSVARRAITRRRRAG